MIPKYMLMRINSAYNTEHDTKVQADETEQIVLTTLSNDGKVHANEDKQTVLTYIAPVRINSAYNT